MVVLTHGNKQRGFTIVELLVVIVVVAILAAISVVAYNGIQERAKKVALDSSLKSIEESLAIYKSQKGTYPTPIAPYSATSVDLSVISPHACLSNSNDGTNYCFIAKDIDRIAEIGGVYKNTVSNYYKSELLSVGGSLPNSPLHTPVTLQSKRYDKTYVVSGVMYRYVISDSNPANIGVFLVYALNAPKCNSGDTELEPDYYNLEYLAIAEGPATTNNTVLCQRKIASSLK